MSAAKHTQQLESFRELWHGGYYEGDPLDPTGPSGYGVFGYCSLLYLTYRVCIKPYVDERTRVLEIGPGRGAWTRCIAACGPRHIWALDALSAEHNGFWEYVGRSPIVQYVQVEDNRCSTVADASIDFFFSYGTFCHMSPADVRDYMQSVFRKMSTGARGFFMYADYDKYNAMLAEASRFSVTRMLNGRRLAPTRWLWKAVPALAPRQTFTPLDKSEPQLPLPGRWYHLGIDNAVRMLTELGFEVLEGDVAVNHRDPVIHFRKP